MNPPNPRPVSSKIQTRHRALQALVYVRQSSLQQIHDHPESRARQYALADHAAALGWSADQVVVIDEDQGQSGQRADSRAGFQRLLTDVTLGRVGLILGLEMSRLARSCKDWHQLLEVCALVGTLLADQDGVYDPRDGNDRLLLGLTGIMSEAELVTMRNRLLRGRWHKAERGELFADPPIGYVKTPTGGVALDPDEQVRAVVRLVFDTFDATGTAYAVLRHLRGNGIRVGVRERTGPRRGQLGWVQPTYSTVRSILHHPFYAGAYAYGRRGPALRTQGGRKGGRVRLAMGEWKVLIRDRVPAYITWDQFLANRARLHANDARGDRGGPPRPGPGLLTGLVTCGSCGWRLHTTQRQTSRPYYICVRHHTTGEPKTCHGLPAGCVDRLVAELVLKAVEPAALAACVHACEVVDRDRKHVLRVRRQAVERARYEADRAGRQFHAVEPESGMLNLSVFNAQQTVLTSGQFQNGSVTLTLSLNAGQPYYLRATSETGSQLAYSLTVAKAGKGRDGGGLTTGEVIGDGLEVRPSLRRSPPSAAAADPVPSSRSDGHAAPASNDAVQFLAASDEQGSEPAAAVRAPAREAGSGSYTWQRGIDALAREDGLWDLAGLRSV